MGYTTEFKGVLQFKEEPTISELNHLKTLLGQDRREIGFEDDAEVYTTKDEYWYHIDLQITSHYEGLEWDGSEKTYCMEHIVNFVTKQMRLKFPKFELIGQLVAQGEDLEDRWTLDMVDGVAVKNFIVFTGTRMTCPKCDEEFLMEEKE